MTRFDRIAARYTRALGSRLVAFALGFAVAAMWVPSAPLPGQYPSLEQFSPIRATEAAISLPLPANYDGSLDTKYRNGEKPQAGCSTPAGWTLLGKGTGIGQVCDQGSSAYKITSEGADDEGDQVLAYKSCASTDCQVSAQIPSVGSWTGHLETFTIFGVGISEGTGNSAWYMQAFVAQSGVPQCKAGTPGPDDFNSTGTGTAPEYLSVTHDDSANELRCLQSEDGITWTTYGTVTRDLTEPNIGYAFGTSHEIGASTTATLAAVTQGTTITAYTPADPPGGAPTQTSSISNQSGTSGTAFSLDISGNFTGETPLTNPYTATGLPGSSGLSFAGSTGILSGTPAAADVSASPYNLSMCAVNVSGATCQSVQFTFSAPSGSGSVFSIAASGSSRVYTCSNVATGANGASWTSIRSSGSHTSPSGGDSIVLAAGVHAGLKFINCGGTGTASRVTIKNDVAGGGPAIIRVVGAAEPLTITSSVGQWWTLDGTGKWSGAPAGMCGVNTSTLADGSTQCGIKLDETGALAVHYLRIDGESGIQGGFTVKGVMVDTTGATGTTGGICFSLNDHAVKAADYPGKFRENILFTNDSAVNCGNDTGEAFYIGPNGADGDVPIRNIELSYNYVESPSRDCFNVKSAWTGANSLHHNHGYNCGTSGKANQDSGFELQTGGNWDIYSNVFLDPFGRGISLVQSTPPSLPNQYINIYNNIIAGYGHGGSVNNEGIMIKGQGTYNYAPLLMYSNTIVNKGAGGAAACISGEGDASTRGTARDNILAGCATAVTGHSDDNNSKVSIANQHFVASGSNDWHLTSTSPACNNSTANAPALDYEGDARPLDSADDQGADENAACP